MTSLRRWLVVTSFSAALILIPPDLLRAEARGQAAQCFSAFETTFHGQTDAQLLAPGVLVGRELKSGEKQSYRVLLDAGQFLEISINQDRSA